jgi:hypothetical protein
VSLLRREPRAVYRVYEESEYLDGEARALDTAGESRQAQPESTGEAPALETPAFEASAFAAPAFQTPAFNAPAPTGSRSTPYLAVLVAAGLIVFFAICVAVLALHFSGAARSRASSSAPGAAERPVSRERPRREPIAVQGAARRPAGSRPLGRSRLSAAPGLQRAAAPTGAYAGARMSSPSAFAGSAPTAIGGAPLAAQIPEAASAEARAAEARAAEIQIAAARATGGEFGFER